MQKAYELTITYRGWYRIRISPRSTYDVDVSYSTLSQHPWRSSITRGHLLHRSHVLVHRRCSAPISIVSGDNCRSVIKVVSKKWGAPLPSPCRPLRSLSPSPSLPQIWWFSREQNDQISCIISTFYAELLHSEYRRWGGWTFMWRG